MGSNDADTGTENRVSGIRIISFWGNCEFFVQGDAA